MKTNYEKLIGTLILFSLLMSVVRTILWFACALVVAWAGMLRDLVVVTARFSRAHPRISTFIALTVTAVITFNRATFGSTAFWVGVSALVLMAYIVIIAGIDPRYNHDPDEVSAG